MSCRIITTSCHIITSSCHVIVSSSSCCCCCHSCRMVNTGVLDQGQVQAGHIVLPGMLQPLLVSVGDEEQVEHTCFLKNMDRQTDTSHCHCRCCHRIHLAHEGGGLRASAGGPSSIAWDTAIVIVCRGGGPRGAMDRSRHRKDLGHSLSIDGRYPIGNRNVQSRAQSNLCKLSPQRPTHRARQWQSQKRITAVGTALTIHGIGQAL